jgi:Leucine-rich repeat (LRR) protein
MKGAGCVSDENPPKKSRNECAFVAERSQAKKKTDCDGWLKLVGAQAFMDLKNREQQSLAALCRDIMCDLQPLNAVVIRMLGFPTRLERLLVWLRAKGHRYKQLKTGSLEQLKKLYLGNNQLTSVPKEIGDLKQLEKLYLHDNNLTSLPKEIGNLEHLKKLCLSYNKLTSLPKEIGNLEQLETLYLYDNKLTSVPKEIGNLKQLKKLSLSGHNKLTSIPKEIGNLKRLEKLYLDNNKLISVPKEIVGLKQRLREYRALRLDSSNNAEALKVCSKRKQ